MNRKLPKFMPTTFYTAIYQRTAFFVYTLMFCTLAIYANSVKAIDYEFPELVITGKQSNYSSTHAEPRELKASSTRQSSNLPNSHHNPNARTKQDPNSTLQTAANPQSTSKQSSRGYISSAPSANTLEQVQDNHSNALISGALVGSLDTIRSPLRLRKHLAIRSSKNQFMRSCLINECFSVGGKQNFLVR
jgi:hypothetical protein